MKPTLVLLLRHALTPTTGIKLMGRTRGVHLSDKGRLQADAAALRRRRPALVEDELALAAEDRFARFDVVGHIGGQL